MRQASQPIKFITHHDSRIRKFTEMVNLID